ncbi:MAG: tetratricopeptide repeat protein [Deltaproteobacteria bacterium]|nr:tetratricopeptide repeat protein [Deltaproteobacteria bacterium]
MIGALLAISLTAGQPAVADPNGSDRAHTEVLPYAYALMGEGDYYRAIGELKRFAFLAPNTPETFPALLSIGRAYELGGKASDGAAWLTRLRPLAPTAPLRASLEVELGYARFLSGDAGGAMEVLQNVLLTSNMAQSLPAVQRARAQYLLAWSYLFIGQSEPAANAFHDVPLAEAPALEQAARDYATLPHKSPLLAGALSALVPGLGHLYLGLPGIALAAFAWNALFIFATYDAMHHHLWGVGSVLAGLELLWYGGAVVGAVSGAEKYNRDAQVNYLDALRGKYDVAPVSWPPSPIH